MKKKLIFSILVFITIGVSIHFSSSPFNNALVSKEHFKVVLNELQDDIYYLYKKDDKKHFSLVPSLNEIDISAPLIKTLSKLTLGHKIIKTEFFTPIFYQSNYVISNLGKMQ